MENKVKPVNGPDKPTLEKHSDLLYDMRRFVGRKPEGKAENNNERPGEVIKVLLHSASISQLEKPGHLN